MHTYDLTIMFRDGHVINKQLTSEYSTDMLPDLMTNGLHFTITEPNGDFLIIRMENVLTIYAKKVS